MIKSQNLFFEYAHANDETNIKKDVILQDINLNIQKGEFVAILGKNGSGKSTLARHLNALLLPTSGTLWVKGLSTNHDENIWNIRQSTGMVFQNPDNQLIATIVEEDIAFGPENLGISPDEIRSRVDNALSTVGMSTYAHHAPSHLSGGQKQRIAIAGVLAMKPDCIVLDEPTAMLDPAGRRDVMETIIRLNRDAGITIILITHFMDEAAKANRIIVMDKGCIVKDNKPRSIFCDVVGMKMLGLDVPQVTALCHALAKQGLPISNELLTIDEFFQEDVIRNIKINIANDKKQVLENVLPQPILYPFISIKNLSHIYNQGSVFEKKAIHDVNIDIGKGEVVGLIGHTGSGKSTLIQHLNALVKPSFGHVFINGEDVNKDKKKLKKLRERVGLVFQYPEHQLFEVTVYKDVAFGPAHMGLSEAEIDERVQDALRMVGLGEEFYEKSPFDLSGGQKRRVAIAGVLAMRPELLILDEPTAGLDPQTREEILSHIQYMHKEMGNTVILVSHSMEDAARLANRIIVMNQGRIVCDGTPKHVFSQYDMLHDIGLSVPQINEIMTQLHERNRDIPIGVFTIPAAVEAIIAILYKEKP